MRVIKGGVMRSIRPNFNGAIDLLHNRAVFASTAFMFFLLQPTFVGPLSVSATHSGDWHTVEKLTITNTAGGNARGRFPKISSNGRYVLIKDQLGEQLFIKDLQDGTQELISQNAAAEPANGVMTNTYSMSGDGRYVAFLTSATNLTTEGIDGTFLRDRQLGTTRLLTNFGTGSVSFSEDGRYLAFSTVESLAANDTNTHLDSYLYDQQLDTYELISVSLNGFAPLDRGSISTSISSDGSVIAFKSTSSGFTDQPWDGIEQTYVRDLNTGETEIATVNNSGLRANSHTEGMLSGNGQFLVFTSLATNLGPSAHAGIFLRDLVSNTTTEIDANLIGARTLPSISADGNYIAFYYNFSVPLVPEDTNNLVDVYVYDRTSSTLTLASVTSNGSLGNGNSLSPEMSKDGNQLVFESQATNLAPNSESLNILRANRVVTPSDTLAPQVTLQGWSANPLLEGQGTTLSVMAADDSSGVEKVEFSIDGGALQPMVLNSTTGTWQATFGSSFVVNTYSIEVIATDAAGNVSVPVTDVLAVYNAANGYVTGHSWLTPTGTDTLPIALDVPSNPNQQAAKITLGFTNIKAATPATGSFDLSYVVKNNQDEFSLSSTIIDWLVVTDGTHASILGRANMTVYTDGAMTVLQNVTVRFDITLGINGAADHLNVRIYEAGVDPSTGTPTWTIDKDSSLSQIMIKP